jgi:hypothetical protein
MGYYTQHIHTTILQFTMGMRKNQAREWNQVTSLISTLVFNSNKRFLKTLQAISFSQHVLF